MTITLAPQIEPSRQAARTVANVSAASRPLLPLFAASLILLLCLSGFASAGPPGSPPVTPRPRPAVKAPLLLGAWEGTLVPLGWMDAIPKVKRLRTSMIVFHSCHSAYSDDCLRFDLTTKRPGMIDRSSGDYTFHQGILALHYGVLSGRGEPPAWLRYKVTPVGNTLRLTALDFMNAPPSATIWRLPKPKHKP